GLVCAGAACRGAGGATAAFHGRSRGDPACRRGDGITAGHRRGGGPGAALRRLFFALWPEVGWCSRLMQAAAPALAAAGGRALALADWHVTLCFLGAVG